MCVKMVPILRMYLVFRQLHSSEAADALMYMICEEACSQRVYGPGERVYVVDDVSRGMYFLTNGVFELREYREEDIEIYRISPLKNLVTATNLGGRTQREQGCAISNKRQSKISHLRLRLTVETLRRIHMMQ